MKAPDDHVLSLLAVLLELFLILLRKAVTMGLIERDSSQVYLYHHELTCNNSNSSNLTNSTNLTNSSECNRGAGIGMLVIFATICVIPSILTFFSICRHGICKHLFNKNNNSKNSSKGRIEEHHFSPIIGVIDTFTCTPKNKIYIISEAFVLAHVLKSIAVSCYFFGNNLDSILHEYGQCLSCDYECVEIVSHVAKGIVIASTFMFHAIPYIAKYIAKCYGWEYEPSHNYEVLGVFGIILKAQSIYSSLDGVFLGNSYCSTAGIVLGSLLIPGIGVIATGCIGKKLCDIYKKKVQDSNESKSSISTPQSCYKGLLIVAIILAFFFVLLFLLSNNQQPLDCYFQCEFKPPSKCSKEMVSEDDPCCDVRNNTITRLTLVMFAIGFIIPLMCLLGPTCCLEPDSEASCCKKRNKVHSEQPKPTAAS